MQLADCRVDGLVTGIPKCSLAHFIGSLDLLSKPNGAIVTETEFQSFIDSQVTPLFPDGLTLLTGIGQFKTASGTVSREHSKLLILLRPVGSHRDCEIEQIRTTYRQQFQQESVLRTDDSAYASLLQYACLTVEHASLSEASGQVQCRTDIP